MSVYKLSLPLCERFGLLPEPSEQARRVSVHAPGRRAPTCSRSLMPVAFQPVPSLPIEIM